MEFVKFKRAVHAQFNQLAAGADINRVGCARIRNTAIGTLLVNISSGLELDDCVTAYERIMAPENYQRPKSIVTKRMIEEAQKKAKRQKILDLMAKKTRR